MEKRKQSLNATHKMSVDFIFESLEKDMFPQWRRFVDVNIWKKTFSEVSTMAIFDIYSQKFNVSRGAAKRLKFTHCLEELRQLEDPTYIKYKDR